MSAVVVTEPMPIWERAHLSDGLRGTPGDVLLRTGPEEAGELRLPGGGLGGESGGGVELELEAFSRHGDAEA